MTILDESVELPESGGSSPVIYNDISLIGDSGSLKIGDRIVGSGSYLMGGSQDTYLNYCDLTYIGRTTYGPTFTGYFYASTFRTPMQYYYGWEIADGGDSWRAFCNTYGTSSLGYVTWDKPASAQATGEGSLTS